MKGASAAASAAAANRINDGGGRSALRSSNNSKKKSRDEARGRAAASKANHGRVRGVEVAAPSDRVPERATDYTERRRAGGAGAHAAATATTAAAASHRHRGAPAASEDEALERRRQAAVRRKRERASATTGTARTGGEVRGTDQQRRDATREEQQHWSTTKQGPARRRHRRQQQGSQEAHHSVVIDDGGGEASEPELEPEVTSRARTTSSRGSGGAVPRSERQLADDEEGRIQQEHGPGSSSPTEDTAPSTLYSSADRGPIPVAKPVDQDEEAADIDQDEEGGGATQAVSSSTVVNPETFGPDVVPAEPVRDDEVIGGQGGGMKGWVRRNKCLVGAVLLLVLGGAVVAGVVAGTRAPPPPASGGGDYGDDGNAPTPTDVPTEYGRTAAPTTQAYGIISEAVADVVADPRALRDPSTPQGAAARWLEEEDAWFAGALDASDAPAWRVRQRFALAVLYYATGGVPATESSTWTDRYGFLNVEDECTGWRGVAVDGGGEQSIRGVTSCDADGRVVSIQLPENNLIGTLTHELVALTELEMLSLGGNRIGGGIPTSVGSMTQLTDVSLGGNGLTGALPSQLGRLTSLRVLRLEDNKLSGMVPSEVANMQSLTTIMLSGNSITDGMGYFCDIDPTPATFQSDCLGSDFPELPPQVMCCCCEICCNEAGTCRANPEITC